MRPYISAADLSAILGTTVTNVDPLVPISLDSACHAVRTYIQQDINYIEDDEEKYDGHGVKKIRLAQRPVRGVSSVVVDGNVLDPSTYNMRKSTLRRTDGDVFPWGWANVVVTYSHGWDIVDPVDPTGEFNTVVPADLRLVTLLAARRVYSSMGELDGALQSETIGGYSYSLSKAAETAVELFDAEKSVLDMYKIGIFP